MKRKTTDPSIFTQMQRIMSEIRNPRIPKHCLWDLTTMVKSRTVLGKLPSTNQNTEQNADPYHPKDKINQINSTTFIHIKACHSNSHELKPIILKFQRVFTKK